jgi:mannose-6-phosphate isomerase-like protein (cupin superfamily)
MNIEPKQPARKGPAQWFAGDVYIDAIHVRKDEPSRMAVTEGIALLGTRDGKVIVARPGQVVYTPPGEEHWHGAAPDNFMVHIAMYEGTAEGDGANWLEHVTDEQYKAAVVAVDSD